MKNVEKLRNARNVLDAALRVVDIGTENNRRRAHRVDLALEYAEERMGEELPREGTRGGSFSPSTTEENAERRRVIQQAMVDASDLPRLVIAIDKACKHLDFLMNRQIEIINEAKLPTEGVLPGCRSCARREDDGGIKIGGHFAPVDSKGTAPADGLCRQCYEFKLATGGVPPVKWCSLRHSLGGKAANKWLTQNFPQLMESVQKKAKAAAITAEDLALRPEDLLAS